VIQTTAGVPFEALVTGGGAGLVGTITVEVYDPGPPVAEIIPAQTTGIVEVRPGTYQAILTVNVAGSFVVRWVAPIGSAEEALIVTGQQLVVVSGDRLLVSVPELRSYLRAGEVGPAVAGSRESDDSFLALLINGASRRAHAHTGRLFIPDPPGDLDPAVTRTVRGHGRRRVRVPDVRELVSVDADGTLIAQDDYELRGHTGQPAVIIAFGEPVRRVVLTGRFGFTTVPADVKLAVLAMAARGFHDAQARLGDRVVDPDGGVTSYFRQLPIEAKAVLDSYRAGPVLA
jgi:hypothetical protein